MPAFDSRLSNDQVKFHLLRQVVIWLQLHTQYLDVNLRMNVIHYFLMNIILYYTISDELTSISRTLC